MKVRTNFVSNSSSASFIIALTESQVCPTCGRTDVNIIDLVKRSSPYGETGIEWDDAEIYVEELKESIEAAKRELKEIKHLPESYMITQYSNVAEIRNQLEEDIEEFTKLINKIEKALFENKKVYGIEVSMHDEVLNRELVAQEKSGTVEILVRMVSLSLFY